MIKKRLSVFLLAFLAGVAIALGATAYLMLDTGIVGTFMFTAGLFFVMTFELNLYTGKVCYIFDNGLSYLCDVLLTWLGNLCGTAAAACLLLETRTSDKLAENAAALCTDKLSDNLLSVFILSVFCNILIYLAVEGYRRAEHSPGKYAAMLFGVTLFIFCGFEHCVANMFYFSAAGVWSGKALLYLVVITLGNTLGGVIFPLTKKVSEVLAK